MNSLNEQRAQVVANQLLSLKPEEVTPPTDFNVSPEYTLIAHLPEHINNSIHAIVSDLKARFPEHYYYAPSQYHLTVVPIPHNHNPERVIESFTPILTG